MIYSTSIWIGETLHEKFYTLTSLCQNKHLKTWTLQNPTVTVLALMKSQLCSKWMNVLLAAIFSLPFCSKTICFYSNIYALHIPADSFSQQVASITTSLLPYLILASESIFAASISWNGFYISHQRAHYKNDLQLPFNSFYRRHIFTYGGFAIYGMSGRPHKESITAYICLFDDKKSLFTPLISLTETQPESLFQKHAAHLFMSLGVALWYLHHSDLYLIKA